MGTKFNYSSHPNRTIVNLNYSNIKRIVKFQYRVGTYRKRYRFSYSNRKEMEVEKPKRLYKEFDEIYIQKLRLRLFLIGEEIESKNPLYTLENRNKMYSISKKINIEKEAKGFKKTKLNSYEKIGRQIKENNNQKLLKRKIGEVFKDKINSLEIKHKILKKSVAKNTLKNNFKNLLKFDLKAINNKTKQFTSIKYQKGLNRKEKWYIRDKIYSLNRDITNNHFIDYKLNHIYSKIKVNLHKEYLSYTLLRNIYSNKLDIFKDYILKRSTLKELIYKNLDYLITRRNTHKALINCCNNNLNKHDSQISRKKIRLLLEKELEELKQNNLSTLFFKTKNEFSVQEQVAIFKELEEIYMNTHNVLIAKKRYELNLTETESFLELKLEEIFVDTLDYLLDRKIIKGCKVEKGKAKLSRKISKSFKLSNLESKLERIIIKNFLQETLRVLLKRKGIRDILENIKGAKLDRKELSTKEILNVFKENVLEKKAIKHLLNKSIEKTFCKEAEIKKEEVKLLKKAFKDILKQEFFNLNKKEQGYLVEELTSSFIKTLELDDNNKDMITKKSSNEIFKEDIEEGIELAKRFWFLEPTTPEDMMILHNVDYDYENNPVEVEEYHQNWDVYYWHDEYKNVIDKHPVTDGNTLGTEEINVSIEIIIDVVNIVIMMWCKFKRAFNGWMGSQAVIGLTNSVYTWLTLETSIDEMHKKGSYEDYMRCYRWLRWEAEQISLKAREDYELHGNYWVEEFILELLRYLEKHHFNVVPLYKSVEKMADMRNIFDNPQNDIPFVLDKIKGMRKKLIEGRN